jgi:aconitate hydratase
VKKTITQKLLEDHLLSGSFTPGTEIGITVDQTLTQDGTGTLTYLQFEAMKIPAVKTALSVSYIDHNTTQLGFENANDHKYLQSIAQKYGIYLSRPGNGICHQVHLERFGKPGKSLLGSDSHTPTCGALGMLAVGAGGLDVALALAGEPFYLTCPRIIKINLTGRLSPWVSAKDVILKVLHIFTTKGNVGCVFEYGGPGLSALSVPERATIANMGAECGVTTSVFPSDEVTKLFLRAQQREEDWVEMGADPDAAYDKIVDIDLSSLEPLAAMPHSPENVRTVRDIGEIEVDQVCMGSCTNSSYKDLATLAIMLKGRVVHPETSLVIAPGTKQVLENVTRNGYLADLIGAGARIAECACTFCTGSCYSPPAGAVSLRTSNRNFLGRSGTKDAQVYLVSPETAAAAAIRGKFTDPRDLGIEYPDVRMPDRFYIDDRMIIKPEDTEDPSSVVIQRGPNIGDPPKNDPFPEGIFGEVTIKVGDGITTDHIIPSGARIKHRSNVANYSEYVFEVVDSTFPQRAREIRTKGEHNIIIAGISYGQGSSREHAAICPMYLGVKTVIAKSFERIHTANLINVGIIPLTFCDEKAYEAIDQGDRMEIQDIGDVLISDGEMTVKNLTKGQEFTVNYSFTERQREILLAGGSLNLVSQRKTNGV